MRRTRLSLAALAVTSVAMVGVPTAASAVPAAESTGATPTSSPAPALDDAAQPDATDPTGTAPAGETVPEEPATASAAEVAPAAAGDVVQDVVQLVAMNDFHGRISPQSGGDGTLVTGPGPDGAYGTTDDTSETVGGAANIATTLRDLRTQFGGNPDSSFFVGAGDLVSASPFNSSVFKDEPTIEVLNALGLDFSAVGNHEFDRGITELKRITAATDGYEAAHGGAVTACEGVTAEVDGCFDDSTGQAFGGAQFPYLAANVVDTATGEPVLPPYEVVTDAAGNRVGLIGVVTTDTPNIVSPDGIAGLTFADEAETINAYAAELTDTAFPGGPVNAIAVMIHEGGTQAGGGAFDRCVGDMAGTPIGAINAEVDPAVDVIISAHTHVPYDCTLPDGDPTHAPRLVTQAGFYGKALTDIRLTLDADGEVDRAASTATNVPVRRTAPDAGIQAIVSYWEGRANAAGGVAVGAQTADLDRAYRGGAAVRDSESGLGNLAADAQLAYARATASLGGADVDVAFMNPGGLRADINCLSSGASDPDGNITYAETFAVQPFSNTVNTVQLTGQGVHDVLEQQWLTRGGAASFLQLSVGGLTYEFDPRRAVGDRVDPASIRIGGQPLDVSATYRVAANSFLIAGGDSFTAFTTGRPSDATVITGGNDVDAFNAYVLAASPVSPPALDRARSLDPAQAFDDDGSGTGSCNPGGTPPPPTTPPGSPTEPAPPAVQPIAGGGTGTGTGSDTGTGGYAGGSLAYTGTPVLQMLGVAGALVAAGVAMTAAGYRRRRGLAD